MRKRVQWLAAALALVPAVTFAQRSLPESYRTYGDSDPQSLGEERPRLPAFPNEGNLVKVPVDRLHEFEFFVDPESVSVGTEGVVRYTVVARARGGASNIVYEGLRCRERERRIYAIGRADGTWSMARNPKWMPVSDLPANLIQATLSDLYFCPARIMVRDAAEARKALIQGAGLR